MKLVNDGSETSLKGFQSLSPSFITIFVAPAPVKVATDTMHLWLRREMLSADPKLGVKSRTNHRADSTTRSRRVEVEEGELRSQRLRQLSPTETLTTRPWLRHRIFYSR